MALPQSLGTGLKEWASVCRALEEGRQVLLLRKGGISESAGEFEVETPQFVLFPTFLHQNVKMLKDAEHAGFAPASAEPATLTLSSAASVTDVIRLQSRGQMDELEEEHIWTAPLIDMRFDYRPEKPLYLLLLRVYRLGEVVTVENTPDYAGCKSWVPLEEEIQIGGAGAVLDDVKYEVARQRIMGVLRAEGGVESAE